MHSHNQKQPAILCLKHKQFTVPCLKVHLVYITSKKTKENNSNYGKKTNHNKPYPVFAKVSQV